MARSNKVNMPTSTAGITRYFDDYKSKIEIKPGHIIILIAIIIIMEILLKIYGPGLFGL